jgi:hypothetical protein
MVCHLNPEVKNTRADLGFELGWNTRDLKITRVGI